MNKKKIIVAISILVIIAVAVIIMFMTLASNKLLIVKEGQKSIENFTSLLINGGTEKELKKVSGIKVVQPLNIMIGSDSYLRAKPSDISGLNEYVNLNKQCALNIEKKIKENFEYKIIKNTSKKDAVIFEIEYKAYYYSAYLMDIQELQKQLSAMTGITNTGGEINDFKTKVTAMKILDTKLGTYVNKNKNTVTFRYESLKNEKAQNAFHSYMMNLEQFNSKDKDLTTLRNECIKRVTGYISEAINLGIIDVNGILK